MSSSLGRECEENANRQPLAGAAYRLFRLQLEEAGDGSAEHPLRTELTLSDIANGNQTPL